MSVNGKHMSINTVWQSIYVQYYKHLSDVSFCLR